MHNPTIATETPLRFALEQIPLVDSLLGSMENVVPICLALSTQESSELHTRLTAHSVNPSSALSWEHVRASLFATKY
jgi:putative addiction module component (TIGR02574 family)